MAEGMDFAVRVTALVSLDTDDLKEAQALVDRMSDSELLAVIYAFEEDAKVGDVE